MIEFFAYSVAAVTIILLSILVYGLFTPCFYSGHRWILTFDNSNMRWVKYCPKCKKIKESW